MVQIRLRVITTAENMKSKVDEEAGIVGTAIMIKVNIILYTKIAHRVIKLNLGAFLDFLEISLTEIIIKTQIMIMGIRDLIKLVILGLPAKSIINNERILKIRYIMVNTLTTTKKYSHPPMPSSLFSAMR